MIDMIRELPAQVTDSPRTVGLALIAVFLVVVVAVFRGEIGEMVRGLWWGFTHPGQAFRDARWSDRAWFLAIVALAIGYFFWVVLR